MEKLKIVMFLTGKTEMEMCKIIGALLLTGGATIHLCGESFRWGELKEISDKILKKNNKTIDEII